MATVPRHVLPVIVAAQFCGTSLWFAVNAVMPDLQRSLGLDAAAVGALTSAVQLGFIAGTLVFALLAVADRHSPRLVFLLCAAAGALCNAAVALWPTASLDFATLWTLRALTGFFLAGIYPVGMKIAATWYPQGLGRALGWLIGALVLGTALPHALRAIGAVGEGSAAWQPVMLAVSGLALAGGVGLWASVPDGAHLPRASTLQWRALGAIATEPRLRASVLGYFGHMWELYTLWVLVPAILATRLAGAAVSWAAFAVIGAGALGCVLGGQLALRLGSARVAGAQLATSGLCCLCAPLALQAGDAVFAAWLLVWGISVAGDSPQFSALTAGNAPRAAVGSVLTLVNSIGFAISIASISLFVALAQRHALAWLLPALGLGPALGLWAMWPLLRERGAPRKA
ncbi:MAG: MFS transporter [Methylibium sp.]|uniref:MFS transporter n=1 Tax=Methylibium sp. TaxID=2067992 RepID=UPI0017A2F778|nr:MFS transporter [Methylibium sp.]MBA2721712.1 MFS transporter [Methylibium sp.]MBA3590189.1 MFS transporter [Methylibium sp.]